MTTFTTYINARRTSSIDAEFAQLEAKAGKTLSGIEKRAEAASRAVAGLTSGRGQGGARSPIPQAYLNGFDQAKVKADRLREANERLARENSNLVRSLRTTGQTLQVVQGPLGPIAGRVNAAADAMVRLTGVTLGLAGAGAALFAYTTAANRFVEIRSKLAPLFDTQEQVNEALGKVAGIAQRARTGLEPVVDLYARMKDGADKLGLSQERVMRITELASKAATLSGGTAQSREAGLYQFSQGFGSGTLAGDELKSVKENTRSLARAISDGLGKLDEFKGVDTSIGKLKELGAEGKLTADVIARALEAAAGDIEARFAKLPPTLASSFTSLQNNATMFVGKFEEATGIVGTLASGLLLLGNNLGAIVNILGGVAAGWAAVAAAEKGRNVAGQVRDTMDRLGAERLAARVALDTAVGQRQAATVRSAALAAHRTQINANIVALERELAVQRQISNEAAVQSRANPAGPGRRMGAAADARSAQLVRELANETERLSVVHHEAIRTDKRLEDQTKAVDTATKRVTASKGLLRTAGMNLIGMLNPVGILVGLLTTAFLAWATAESEAEKNAKKLEDAQRKLAVVIDFTTGKIIEQNQALLAGTRIEVGRQVASGNANIRDLRGQIAGLAAQFRPRNAGTATNPVYVNPRLSGTQMQAKSLLEAYGSGQNPSTGALVSALENLAKADPSLRALAEQVAELGTKAVNAARSTEQAAAGLRILQGANDEETKRRARGDFTGGISAEQRASGKTEAQVQAEIQAEAKRLRDRRYAAEVQKNEQLQALNERRAKIGEANYIREAAQIENTYRLALEGISKQEGANARRLEREEERKKRAHEAELRRIERENEARAKRTERRKDILGGWSDEPKAVVKAADDIRELNRLVGKTMDDMAGGLYTQAMADADAERIREGLQRPYNEYMEERQRDANISGLIVAGFEAEAEALRRTYDLYDSIGSITLEQYDSILETVRAEERVNEVLEQRERLLAPLRSSVAALRDDITGALEDFMAGGNPIKGIKGIIKGALSSFNKATAVQIAERITGGLDGKMREFLRGSATVDAKIAQYVSALDQSGDSAVSAALGVDHLTSAAERAATALDGVANAAGGGALAPGLPTPMGAGGSAVMGAAASAMMMLTGAGSAGAIPKSFYKPGTKIGGGIGDDVIWKALGPLGAVITENLRPQSRQNAYYAAGLTKAKVSKHTTTEDAWDVRLPKGMSFNGATRLIEKAAKEMGVQLVSKLDETAKGGTGRHGHYTFARGRGAVAGGAGGPDLDPAMFGGIPVSIAQDAIQSVNEIAQSLRGPMTQSGDPNHATVTAPAGSGRRQPGGAQGEQKPMSPTEYWNKVGGELGSKLDKTFGTKFFNGIGSKLGQAMQGAQTGSMVAGVGKMLWSKFSTTGSQIGGAIGSFLPIPGGEIIGSIIGGTIGGLLKKTKKASVTVSGSGGAVDVGDAVGNSSKRKGAATQMGGALGTAIQQIAEQLGADIGTFGVSIGMRKDKFVVDPSGRGRTKGSGVVKFKDEQEAIEFALRDAIRDGALMGISAAARTLLLKGKDLEGQLRKAIGIEQIPKRLMAIKDPVRFAITELNKEFENLIRWLQEGGATAAQFAEAEELYNLERQRAIEQASQNATSGIQKYIDDMLGGPQSPLNRRTVYNNAKATLDPLAAKVQAGQAVDSDDLLEAVARFQEASQALNGSGGGFFADFDYLLGLLNRAKTNIAGNTTTTPGDMPASPFSDAAIQALITGTTSTTEAINYQTQYLGGLLGQLVNRGGLAMERSTDPGTFGLLPTGEVRYYNGQPVPVYSTR